EQILCYRYYEDFAYHYCKADNESGQEDSEDDVYPEIDLVSPVERREVSFEAASLVLESDPSIPDEGELGSEDRVEYLDPEGEGVAELEEPSVERRPGDGRSHSDRG